MVVNTLEACGVSKRSGFDSCPHRHKKVKIMELLIIYAIVFTVVYGGLWLNDFLLERERKLIMEGKKEPWIVRNNRRRKKTGVKHGKKER